MKGRRMCGLLLNLFLLFPACAYAEKHSDHEQSDRIVDLVESTHIIRELVSHGRLAEVLEEHTPEQLDLLLNNFSCAQMALEAEVLSALVPVVVYFFNDRCQASSLINALERLATIFGDKVKFVALDAGKLFSLAKDAEIQCYPTIFILRNRDIIVRLEGDITLEHLQRELDAIAIRSDTEVG